MAWAGMRGGLSLAAALAIPLRLADGTPFPDRDLVIVVAAAVIVTSLLYRAPACRGCCADSACGLRISELRRTKPG